MKVEGIVYLQYIDSECGPGPETCYSVSVLTPDGGLH